MYSTSPPSLSQNELLSNIRTLQAAKSTTVVPVVSGLGHAIGYTRVSTTMQAEEGNSLVEQRAAITDYCTRNNLILDDVYTDPAVSGGERNRPDLNRAINYLSPGMKLILISVDRLSRDIRHVIEIKDLVHKKSCSIYI